jgi:hypothetical protein
MMTASRILIKSDERNRSALDPSPDTGWYLLGGIGLVFAVVAAADLALAWYPLRFGDAEWEFGTVTAVFGGLPLLTMGLGLSFGAAVARGNLVRLRLISIVLGLVSLVLLGSLVLYLTTVPTALATEAEPLIKTGIQKAILKTTVEGVLYPLCYLWIAILGWKHAQKA